MYWKTSPAPRILKPAPGTGHGRRPYLTVILTDENRTRTKLFVHHLVAKAFIGPRPKGQQVRHLNDILADNRLANLAYGTPLQNTADSIRNGTQHAVCVLAKIPVCKWGHPFDGVNGYTKIQRSGKPRRGCHACDARRARERRQRAKETTG